MNPEYEHRCSGADPCVEYSARVSAAVDAFLGGCDDAAAGLVRQAFNYATAHQLAPLDDVEGAL